MIARKDVICYGFIDAHDVLHTQVVEECSNTVFLHGQLASGEWVAFESEGYHLGAWCKQHGFKYLRAEKEVKFNLVVQA